MTQNRDTYRTGTSNDRLVQFHNRVRRSTLQKIEDIAEDMKWSKASVVRLLLEIGLDHGNFDSETSKLVKCLECSQEMVNAEEDQYMCRGCGSKAEVKSIWN